MGLSKVIVRGLVKQFGTSMALRGVDASFEAGRLTVVEGPNGSGKTTLLRIIGTILRPTRGQLAYPPLGADLRRIRAEIGWVSHELLAYPDLSGRQNIELAARLHGLDPARAWQRARARFRLGRFAEQRVRTNSRGQRQRIALARALVHDPTLVLLDEPTTGLDRAGTEELLEVVQELLERRAIVIVVSPSGGPLEQRADARLGLDRGRVVAR